MGSEARARERRRREVIHRTRLFGGKMTAEEVHAKYAWRERCGRCGGAPVILVRLLMLHDDFVEKFPQAAAAVAMTNPRGPYVPTFPTTYGPMLIYETALACRAHQAELERDAAHAPSWMLVEIDRGPGADRPNVLIDNRARQ